MLRLGRLPEESKILIRAPSVPRILQLTYLSHLSKSDLALLRINAVGRTDSGKLIAVDRTVSTGVFQLEHEMAILLLPLKSC